MRRCCLTLLLLVCLPTQAQQLCFLMAENYYEQLYCEIKAKGRGNNLPDFYDFQNNQPITQALLLKPHTRRLGIKLKMPKASSHTEANKHRGAAVAAPLPSTASPLVGCQIVGAIIHCQDSRYHLTGNRANRHLAEGALAADNQLLLPRYNGGDLQRYLAAAYRLYLEKMLAIGLGGSTMTFAKFHYLYRDLTDKGADFVERSKTVFEYLKADKKRIAVDESISPVAELTLAECYPHGSDLIACGHGRSNYLYQAAP